MNQNIRNSYPAPDFTLLKEMAEGDHDFFMEIISLFLENAPAMVTAMKDSSDNEDLDKLRFVSHKIRSDLHIVGIKYAIGTVESIEKSAGIGINERDLVKLAVEMINYGIEDLKKVK